MCMTPIKSKVSLYWFLFVVAASLGLFLYLIKQDSSRTLARLVKIEPTYFKNEEEVVKAIDKSLTEEIKKNQFYWLGVEPEKSEQIDVAIHIIKKLKMQQSFQRIIVDEELGLKNDRLLQLGFTDVVSVKANLFELGERLHDFEKNSASYILVSASIYTNTFLKKNPLSILKEKYGLNPMTFSFAYFPITIKDEKNMLFPCHSEDQSGTSEWGCAVVSRARFARKKIKNDLQPWLGLMDLYGEKDYVLLFKKNNE